MSCCAIIVVVFSAGQTQAEKGMRFKKADKNADGTIDQKEWKMEQQREHEKRSQVNNWWEKRADTNNDGTVDKTELANWKTTSKERIDLNGDGTIDAKERRLSWRHGRSKVNTDIEKRYDANGDGWLSPDEVRNLLRARAELIKTKGKAKVDSTVEEEYDGNNDGVLEAPEAQNMIQDAK